MGFLVENQTYFLHCLTMKNGEHIEISDDVGIACYQSQHNSNAKYVNEWMYLLEAISHWFHFNSRNCLVDEGLCV